MRIPFACLVAAAVIAGARPAGAQLLTQPGGASMASLVGIHVFGIIEGETMTAKKSFDAVLAGSNTTTLIFQGGGVEVTLWKGAFARVAGARSTNTGSRVFLDSSNFPHTLNVPMTIDVTPIEVGGGWRFGGGRRQARRLLTFVPYAGAALLLQRYKETSEAASADENIDTTDKGQSIFGGVEIGIKFVKVGVEAQYRRVPITAGAGSLAEAFGEKDLGGTVFRITLGVGF